MGLPPPAHIHWLDGPLQLVAALAGESAWDYVWASDDDSIKDVEHIVVPASRSSVEARILGGIGASIRASVKARVERSVEQSVCNLVGGNIVEAVEASIDEKGWDFLNDEFVGGSSRSSIVAYLNAAWLAYYRFFDTYLAPNDLHALAHFNERVSGYWLGQEVAVLVRRPIRLERDAGGRLHSATGR